MSNSKSRSGSARRGGVDHLEVIPYRPHRSWPVQAVLLAWRWLAELLVITFLVVAMVKVREVFGVSWSFAVPFVLTLVVLPFLLPVVGSYTRPLVWVLVTRHRLRAYFVECRLFNRSGKLPWILTATPTAVGERVWLWLVPGLSIHDFEDQAEQIASACWARTARVERHTSIGSLIRMDVVRRDPLTTGGTLPSVLVPVSRRSEDDHEQAASAAAPLDLSRPVTIDLTDPAYGSREGETVREKGAPRNGRSTINGTTPGSNGPRPVSRGGEDLSDYV